MRLSLVFSSLIVSTFASSLLKNDNLQYSTIEARQQNLPIVKLPYGTWQAQKYDAANDLYVFKNIRFAAPPVGELRFAKPAPPLVNETIQNGNFGPACVQSVPLSMVGAGSGGSLMSSIGSMVDIGTLASGSKETGEDCLFLDVFVPAKALKDQVKLPVVNWIYGGAYLMGSKEGIYDGTAIVKASGGNVIYVGANYRVGLFGFLAGRTMEKEGTPNAGLYDQQAVFQWIKKYINLFGGDPENLSVWGESAGAGSITHHLTAFGGRNESLFKRAVIQSPAYDPQIDRKGQLEKQFQDIATLAGCAGKGMACLRSVDVKALKIASDKYVAQMPGGKPGLGPAADGNFVRQLPVLEFASGNFVKGVETIINSHVLDEGKMFVPSVVDEGVIDAVLQHYFGTSSATKAAISKQFAAIPDLKARIKDLFTYSTFTCNNRFISEAFKGKTYNLQYSRGLGIHGMDISADFYKGPTFSTFRDKTFGTFAATFQSYLTSHARTGDPNKLRDGGGIEWPIVTFGATLSNVLNATDLGFELISDEKTKAEDCDFWKDVLAGMTSSLGYAAPGAVVKSSLIGPAENPSSNF